MTTHDAGDSDGVLARRAALGDRAALAVIFDRYAPRILALCTSMLRGRADAEDCLQDVFVIAATRLPGLREPEKLRSWLFAVARHECLARIGKAAREVPVDTVPDSPAGDRDQPANRAVAAELAEVVHSATAGLSPRDRLALELADRQGLATDELGAALGMSPSSAYKLLVRARATARRSLGALLIARTSRGECTRLELLLAGWDGQLTQLVRKRIARHVEECDTCAERERRLVSPAALLGGMPAIAIPVRLRSDILAAADRARHGGPQAAWRDGWPPSGRLPVSRRVVGIGAAAAVVVLIVVVALLVPRQRPGQPVALGHSAVSIPTTTAVPTTTVVRSHGTRTVAVAPPATTTVSATCVPATTRAVPTRTSTPATDSCDPPPTTTTTAPTATPPPPTTSSFIPIE
ncbi:MAG TPA: sigma-70 family RNA polymerase sigma factor [Pseudonocardiaceae bacterium]|nr:sigma-70 family RNA polymerase sigma factor [Pseudonocardiaceae bacterium]